MSESFNHPRAAGALLSLGLILLGAPALADHADYRYELKGRPVLRVVTDDAHVRVRPGRPRRIEIGLTTVGWEIDEGELRITQKQVGDRVSFEVREPWIRWGFIGRRRVELDITVPPELDLEVTTGDGAVTIEAISGQVAIHTGDGAVRASDLRGDLQLETGDGRISATGLDGRLRGDSGDGRIIATGRFDALELHTGDGNLEVGVERGSRVQAEWKLTSGDGSLLLRLPSDLRADVDASTGDGQVSTDLPIRVQGRIRNHSLRGSLNGGGGRIVLRTGDGPIRIEAQ